jgi:hypothetical protein
VILDKKHRLEIMITRSKQLNALIDLDRLLFDNASSVLDKLKEEFDKEIKDLKEYIKI